MTSVSLAAAIELTTGRSARVLCPTECDPSLLRKKDRLCRDEEELERQLRGAKRIIADPLLRPICPKDVPFAELPSEAFSGRLFRDRIPDLVSRFDACLKEML